MFSLTPRRLALILPLLATLPATAQSVTEDRKLVATNAVCCGYFGQSVAISGANVIVGAWAAGGPNILPGAAYIFDSETGQQRFRLSPSDLASGDSFGFSVDLSGTTAIVGAWQDDDAGDNSGSAYLFDVTTGQQLRKLLASDGAAEDRFGLAVGISGATAIVGAYQDGDGGENSGSAYIFNTVTGQQLFKLTSPNAAPFDEFGRTVAISGTTAIVGTVGDDGVGVNSGAAYLFDTTTGQMLFKLTPSDAAAFRGFGFSVGISGTTAIVGTIFDDSAGSLTGAAYIFDTTTGQQLFKLTSNDAAELDQLGTSVAISNGKAIVGAINDTVGGAITGSAYLFDAATGRQITRLTASDGAADDRFGASVAISSTTAIVGAWGDDDASFDSGAAYLFPASPCTADWNGDGAVNFFDIIAFIGAFNAQSSVADVAVPFGTLNFADVAGYLQLYNAGCP